MWLAWSPDGRWIAYNTSYGSRVAYDQLWIADIQSNRSRQVYWGKQPDAEDMSKVYWTP